MSMTNTSYKKKKLLYKLGEYVFLLEKTEMDNAKKEST